ncbi:MAG: prolipoprotein diacylglyceryl transferase [Bacteroidetes bacterium]|nr:prolipoprotein diacylglyceryl transferase [Bacteroidota bacterium]
MYPTIYHAFQDIFGIELSFLKIANTFGLFVALAFLAANYIMTLELKRKEKEGILNPLNYKVILGKTLPVYDFVINTIFGFIIGYKFVPLLINKAIIDNGVQQFIFSLKGNWISGIILAVLFFYFKKRESDKQKLPEPIEKEIVLHPWQNMGYFTIVAAVAGIAGAKIFHWFEYWDDFVKYPLENIFSASGLTFFGGLIAGGAGVLWAARKKGISALNMLDVGAPAMMLAYGVGRIGCHLSGDGDWGIVNTTTKPSFLSFMPDWFWAYNYPNNVAGQCDPTNGNMPCSFEITPYLLKPVFPTPLWEAIAAILLFGVLWFLRKRIKTTGVLFGIYLLFAAVERFLIETIRVNSKYNILGMHPSQAELISVFLFISGIILIYFSMKKRNEKIETNGSGLGDVTE